MSDCERQMSGRESGVCVEEGREVSGNSQKQILYVWEQRWKQSITGINLQSQG